MSDEIRLPNGSVPAQRELPTQFGHICEHAGCGKIAGLGFGKPKQESHWFCFEHRDEGERYL